MFSCFSFFSYILVVSYTPGPINIMSMNNAKNVGFKKGIIFNLGNFTGHFLVMVLCLIFSKALYAVIPQIQFPMKIIASAYLVYLIFKIIIPSKKETTGEGFITGALLQLINPKVIMFGLTVMTSYILPYYSEIPTIILFTVLLSSVQLTGNICWTLFGSTANKLFNTHGKILNFVMAVLLLYCAVKLYL